MANRFWVGGTATWDSTTTANWATTSGGAPGASVPGSADTPTFDTNSGTNTITTNYSPTVAALNMLTGTATLSLGASLTVTGNIVVTNGTLITNNNGITCGTIGKAVGTATFTFGSSTITCTASSGTSFSIIAAGATITANTAIIQCTGLNITVSGGSQNLNGMSFVLNGGGTMNFNGNNTIASLTVTGATTSDSLSFSGTCVMNNLTLTGLSLTSRLSVISSAVGTARTETITNAPTLSNVDFMDIKAAGTGGTWSGTSIGDQGGNTNITFTPPVTRYWVATAGGNGTATSSWSASSGGASGASVPICHDTVIFDANSITATGKQITMGILRWGKDVNMTGLLNTPQFVYNTAAETPSVYGSLTLAPITVVPANNSFSLRGRGNHTLTTAGVSLTTTGALSFIGPGGTYTLQDNLTVGAALTNAGVAIGATTQNVTIGTTFSCSVPSGFNPSLTMGSGTWTINGTGAVWTAVATLGITPGTSTLVLSDTSTAAKTFAGGGLTYNNLTTAANGAGLVTFTGANTFNTLTLGAGTPVVMPASTATSFTNLLATGNAVSNPGYLRMPGLAGQWVSTPDASALAIPGDVDIRIRTAQDNWKPTGPATVIAQSSAADFGFAAFVQNTTGNLRFRFSQDGSTVIDNQSTAANTFANGAIGWVRVTRSASTGTLTFYTSSTSTNDPTAVTWTQLGATVATATGAMWNSSQVMEFGSSSQGTSQANMFPMNYYRVAVYTTIDGSTSIFDADFTSVIAGASSFAESSSNAATVTLHGAATQAWGRTAIMSSTAGTAATLSDPRGVIRGDYLTIQDSTATGGANFYAGANSLNVSNNTGWNFGVSPNVNGQFLSFFN